MKARNEEGLEDWVEGDGSGHNALYENMHRGLIVCLIKGYEYLHCQPYCMM